jgi:hypothetical protein
LQFPRIDGLDWAADGKTAIDIRATGDGIEMEIFLDLPIDPLETFG